MGLMQLMMVIVTALMLVRAALCHSTMSEPQPFSPGYCRFEDDPEANCPGPCDLRGIEGGYSNFDSPDNPAAVYWRGKKVTIKYHRNNHGPGGFVRITLVKPEDVMNKAVHERNAFHYSCWGAVPVVAKSNELSTDKFGFTFVGNDGEEHSAEKGYYTTSLRIPACVPNGVYVLGWVWYGGTGSHPIQSNSQVEPQPWGYFGDYWACSYIRVKGGKALSNRCDPVFVNDMSKFSSEGCMAANDEPGICSKEPCNVTAFYRKPRPFLSGPPPPISPDNFQ